MRCRVIEMRPYYVILSRRRRIIFYSLAGQGLCSCRFYRRKGGVHLKKLRTDSARCTGCGLCERVCSRAWHKTEDTEKSAIRITPGSQAGYELSVCDQCGACMDMCFAMALKRVGNGVVRLDKKDCVGCLVCVGECPREAMRYHDDLPAPFKCTACGLCAAQCPAGALKIVEV